MVMGSITLLNILLSTWILSYLELLESFPWNSGPVGTSTISFMLARTIYCIALYIFRGVFSFFFFRVHHSTRSRDLSTRFFPDSRTRYTGPDLPKTRMLSNTNIQIEPLSFLCSVVYHNYIILITVQITLETKQSLISFP